MNATVVLPARVATPSLKCTGPSRCFVFKPVRGARQVASAPCSSSSSACTEPASEPVEKQDTSAFQAFRQQLSKVSQMAVVLPFANMALGSGGSMTELYGALSKVLDVYLVLLTVRVLLTWFRNISWASEPFATIRQFTDPYLNVFRGVIPAIGGMDLSPMLGFFILSFAAKQLRRLSLGI